jgi:hypothetical protein
MGTGAVVLSARRRLELCPLEHLPSSSCMVCIICTRLICICIIITWGIIASMVVLDDVGAVKAWVSACIWSVIAHRLSRTLLDTDHLSCCKITDTGLRVTTGACNGAGNNLNAVVESYGEGAVATDYPCLLINCPASLHTVLCICSSVI